MYANHDELLDRIVAWAKQDDNIRAVVVTGSSSRGDASSDRFSDRDVEIIARNRTPLLEDDRWIHAIAPVWVSLYLANDDDTHTRLVFFEGARKIDFSVNEANRLTEQQDGLNDLYQRGYRFLVDKDDLAASLPEPTRKPPRVALPTEQQFRDTVNEFWFEAAHMPTYLTRGDLWVVKTRDWTMKEMMLRLIEWHTLATRGAETDVWYIGTKMKQWVHPSIWDEVQEVFGRFDAADSYRSLKASMRLFSRLSREIAEALGFAWPVASESHIRAYVSEFESQFQATDSA
jgi:aminoglycoside 6-adenylyltransferase